MLVIISKVLVVFVYAAVGFFCRKLDILPGEANKYFIALLMSVTTPCLLFESIMSKQLTDGMMLSTVVVLFLAAALYSVAGILGLFIAQKLRFSKPNELSVAMSASNNGFMGIPVTQAAFGGNILYYLIIENVSLNLYLYIVALFQFNYGKNVTKEKAPLRERVKPFIKLTNIVAIVATVLLFAGVTIPAYPMEIVKTIGDVTVPLSMIVVGIQLAESDFTRMIRDKALLFTSFYKLILVPLAALLIAFALPFDSAVKVGFVITMIFPTSVSSSALATYNGCDGQIVAEAVAQTTVFSLITIPVWIVILNNLFL